eukprot:gnl/Spiro4/8512_TR4466_c0_g1_i1.p1 gnl/Spiro4/8512_TR4466_c0_g1~~gnl/Spiro4/8512_TR4466_c0_g1_i1.p1  ORF type:complete len:812 (-),score=227.60 gnl/Spiro4/8512_TR4466_c0_g1_i1:16-2451(-)
MPNTNIVSDEEDVAHAALWRSSLARTPYRDQSGLYSSSYLPEEHMVASCGGLAAHDGANYLAQSGHSRENGKPCIQILAMDDSANLQVVHRFFHKVSYALEWSGDFLASASETGVIVYRLPYEQFADPAAAKQCKVAAQFSCPGGGSARCVSVNSLLHRQFFAGAEGNTFHIWTIDRAGSPVNSYSLTRGVGAVQWSPHSRNELAAGCDGGSLITYDFRATTIGWRWNHPRGAGVLDVKWSPLVPHLLASASEDMVRVWDLRRTAEPVRVLAGHQNSPMRVAWSQSAPELLVSGGLDARLCVWNIRAPPPHHLVLRVGDQVFADAISSVCFSEVRTNLLCVGCSEGLSLGVKFEPQLFELMAQSRFEPGSIERESKVEALVYKRELGRAGEAILAVATQLFKEGKTARAQSVIRLGMPYAISAKGTPPPAGVSFDQELADWAYYMPENLREGLGDPIKPVTVKRLEMLAAQVNVVMCIESGAVEKLLAMETEIYERLKTSSLFSLETLKGLIRAVMAHNYLKGLDMALQVGRLLTEHSRFGEFCCIAHTLLHPTVFDTTATTETADTVPPRLANELRQASSILGHLSQLREVSAAMFEPNPVPAVLQAVRACPQLSISVAVQLTYLNAMMSAAASNVREYERFFVYAASLLQYVEGFEFTSRVEAIVLLMHKTLRHHIRSTVKKSRGWESLTQLCEFLLTLVDIGLQVPSLRDALVLLMMGNKTSDTNNNKKSHTPTLLVAVGDSLGALAANTGSGPGKHEAAQIATQILSTVQQRAAEGEDKKASPGEESPMSRAEFLSPITALLKTFSE